VVPLFSWIVRVTMRAYQIEVALLCALLLIKLKIPLLVGEAVCFVAIHFFV
jgi:hypothetical protein